MPKGFWPGLHGIPDIFHRSPIRQMSIYRWLTSGMVLIVIATIVLGGVPAIGLIWWQLEHQVQLRLLSAQSSTQALFASEQRNLLQFAELVSTRPSLCALLRSSEQSELVSYLDTLRRDTTADALIVVTADKRIITSGFLKPPPEVFTDQFSLRQANFVTFEDSSGLGIFAISQISAKGCATGAMGRVSAIQLLDQDFMRRLAQDTGLEQSLIIGGRRIVTSSPHLHDLPLNPDAATEVVRSKQACCTTGVSGNETYYVGIAPLLDGAGNVVALSEVALPADAIRGATFKTIALYLGLGILVALGGMWFAWLLTRRITTPLKSLSEAAERMGAGDLETPIAADSGWTDIDLLACQLDDSRRNLQQIQGIARRQLAHIVHLLAATREGIVSLDDGGIITWANADAGRLLGYDNRELLRKHYMKIFQPLAGEMVSIHDILNPAVGKPPPERLTILNGQGSFTTLAVVCVRLDIDAADGGRKRAERVLILREVGEEQALNRLRSEFLANVAHEFRTPLSSIAASTELMLDEGDEMQAGEVTYLAHRINLSVIHLQHLVNNLLESAIIEAGVFRLRMRSLCLQDLLNEVVEMMLPLIQRREQHLDLMVSNEQPSMVCADADRLKQALVNLLENASKFSPSNTSITLSVSEEADMLTFSVSDCGPGLPTERFESLFTRFFVGKNPGGAQYGIGLGLPIVKAIAEAHGGQVGATNRQEGGAKVWFTIPLQPSYVEESNDKNPGG